MKLQISYNILDLDKALDVAAQTAEYADILGVGSLILLQNGIKAITAFKERFPTKKIFAEATIIEKGDLSVKILAQAGAHYVSLLSGGSIATLKKGTESGDEYGSKIMINLIDSVSLEQSAIDAKTIGVHGVIFYVTSIIKDTIGLNTAWQSVRGNSLLPVFVTGNIGRESIHQIIELKPDVIMIGQAITHADQLAEEAAYFHELIKKS